MGDWLHDIYIYIPRLQEPVDFLSLGEHVQEHMHVIGFTAGAVLQDMCQSMQCSLRQSNLKYWTRLEPQSVPLNSLVAD